MIITAAEKHNIDLKQSWMIGNSSRDIDAGKRAGCKTILIEAKTRIPPPILLRKEEQVQADFKAVNMKEAVNIVKRFYRQLELQEKLAKEIPQNPERPRFRTIHPPAAAPIPHPVPPPAFSPVPKPVPVSAVVTPAVISTPQQTTTQVQEQPATPVRQSRRSRTIPVEPPSPAPQPPFFQTAAETKNAEEKPEANTPEQLLNSILQELKIMRRSQDDGEFSIIRLMAGILQGIVFFCLLAGILLMMQTPKDSDLILITLGFAIVLQLMALTLYLIHQQK